MNLVTSLCYLLIFYKSVHHNLAEIDDSSTDADIQPGGGYIFMGEYSICSCKENRIFLEFVMYLADNIIPYDDVNNCNGYAIRPFGDTTLNRTSMQTYHDRVDLESYITIWINKFTGDKHCQFPNNATYQSALLNILDQVSGKTQPSYKKYAVFLQGETDTIVDLRVSLPIAQEIASYDPIVYIWDHSQNGDQTVLFLTLTGGKQQNIIRSNSSLIELINLAKAQIFPSFANIGCGNASSDPLPTVSEPPLPTQPEYCFDDIILEPTDSATPATTKGSTIITNTTPQNYKISTNGTTIYPSSITSTVTTTVTTTVTPTPPSKTVIIVIAISLFLLIIALVAVIIIFCRRKIKNRRSLVGIIVKQHEMNDREAKYLAETADKFKLNSNKINVYHDKNIGSGSTATVYEGFLNGTCAIGETVQNITLKQKYANCKVAIKIPKQMNHSETEQIMRELQAMRQIGYHDHIAILLGWSYQNGLPSLVFELAKSDLFTYICGFRETPNSCMPFKEILSVGWQVSSGMEYVSSFNMVHRDVAARNILLYEGLYAKISDFGLCCHCDESFTYQATLNKKLPIRWLSIEALVDRTFSEKSDVWAFGVMLYEMSTNGAVPYSLLSNYEILEFLQNGKRLEKPENTNEELYNLMLDCWKESVIERITFSNITQKLQSYLENETQTYGYLSVVPSENMVQ